MKRNRKSCSRPRLATKADAVGSLFLVSWQWARILWWRFASALAVLLLMILLGVQAKAGGLTVLTHGYQFDKDEPPLTWLDTMAYDVYRSTNMNSAVYTMTVDHVSGSLRVTELRHEYGPKLSSAANTSGEVIVKLYWVNVASFADFTPPRFKAKTGQVASVAAQGLLNWSDDRNPLTGTVHLIGHSRGGSVMCEIARILGLSGIWVDHLTTLDPQPVSTYGDLSMRAWETIAYFDNYYQKGAPVSGEDVIRAYSRRIYTAFLSGGYSNPVAGSHSDIHLWYFGTINTDPNASNGERSFSAQMRSSWYLNMDDGGERAGYWLSRIKGGAANRSVGEPAKGKVNFGKGYQALNRETLLRLFSGETWPSIIDVDRTFRGKSSSGVDSYRSVVRYQDFDSAATITIRLDSDKNPTPMPGDILFPSNQFKVRATRSVAATGWDAKLIEINWDTSGVPSGTYWVNTEITDSPNTRSFYDLRPITVTNTGVSPGTGGGTTPVVTAPAVPANLAATATSSSSISLAWQDKSNNESGFRIERKTGVGGNWAAIVTNKRANSTTHTDTGLSVGTPYFYRVAAFNSAGGSDKFSDEASATTLQGPPQVRDLFVTFENGGTTSNYSYSPNPVSPVTNHVLRYTDGTTVTLVAPSVATNGNLFSHWFRGGQVFSTTQAISLTVSQSETLKAVYVSPPVVDSRTLNLSVSPSSAGTATGGGNFGQGAWVTIKATPNSGFNFWNWTTSGGQLFSAHAELSFQLTTNLNLVANFVPSGGAYSVTATANPPAGGTVSGAGNYSNGQTATLIATPVDGWTFGTWSENGVIVSFNSTVSFPVNQSRNLAATFNPDFSKNYTLSITAINGTAIRSPNQTAYTPGSTVSVTATPHPGYYFTGWSQDVSGTANPLSVLMTVNKMVTANFSPVPSAAYTLSGQSVIHDGSAGSVVRSPNQAFYAEGSTVLLTATAGSGSVFVGWKGDAYGTANPFSMTMDSNKIAYAQFVKPSNGSAVVELKSPLFTFNLPGTQSSATGVIRNPTTSGAVLYFAATANVPWIKMGSSMGSIPGFTGQSEGVIGFICEENPFNVPRTGQIWVYAPGAINSPQIFTVNQAAAVPHYTLQTHAENGSVSRSPDQTRYPTGTGVALTAIPIDGYAFSSWSGDASGSQNPLTVTMNSNKVITATFIRLPNPDVVAQLTPSLTSGPAGSKLTFNGTVKNLGVDPSAPGKVYLRISDSSAIPPSITPGHAPFADFGSLNPNGFENMSLEFVIPQDFPIGGYHLWVLVDPENACGEQSSSRVNNQAAYAFQVVPDTIAPSIQVSVPPAAISKTATPSLSLAGNASDNIAVTQVSWENDRGGSGVAAGLNEWAVNEVPLQLGINVITITAFDREGNRVSAMRTVTYYPPDDVPPTVAVTFPTTESTFNVIEDRMSLGGVASDNFAIDQVVWTNDRGGSGTAIGLETWVADSVPLKSGRNTITIICTDHADNASEATLLVTHTPSRIPHRPVTVIRKPTSRARIEGDGTLVEGTASARDGIDAVYYQVNDGPWLTASGGAAWSFATDLAPGLNAVRVKTVDAFGVESLVVSRLLTRVARAGLEIDVVGEGRVAYGGFTTPQNLEIGKNYSLTARPAKGWMFAGWSGGLVSSLPKIKFTMREGLDTTATFVENPFEDLGGAYLGLARAEPEAHESNGLLRATVTGKGGFSAALLLGGQSHRLSGKFDTNGYWTGQIHRSRQTPLSALLMLDVAGDSETLGGLVASEDFSTSVQADRAVFHARQNPAPDAGRFTFAIEPDMDQPLAPVGYGAGTLLVDAAGKIKVQGHLADGTALTFAGHVSRNGTWPLHAVLYKKGGSITGQMLLADLPGSDTAGALYWFKPQRPRDARFQTGFESRPGFLAQRYTPPAAKNLRILSLWDAGDGEGTLSLSGPNLAAELLQPVTWQTDNKLASDAGVIQGLRWIPTTKAGLFNGSFLNPTTGKRLPLRGALLQKTGEGLGWFLGPASAGAVLLERAPDEEP